VLEATHSYKADVNIIETSFEATPTIDETDTVEPNWFYFEN
jgi:hypothetical protein